MDTHRRLLSLAVMAAAVAASIALAHAAQTGDKDGRKESEKRPKLVLKAQPMISMSPSKVNLKAELLGGADDYEELYCPTAEWDWGDGTQSESTSDCEPYQPGKSEIRRRYTVDHVFHAGNYQVSFRLKRHDKVIVSAMVHLQVQPGLDEFQR